MTGAGASKDGCSTKFHQRCGEHQPSSSALLWGQKTTASKQAGPQPLSAHSHWQQHPASCTAHPAQACLFTHRPLLLNAPAILTSLSSLTVLERNVSSILPLILQNESLKHRLGHAKVTVLGSLSKTHRPEQTIAQLML